MTVEQLRAEFPRSLVELLVEYKKLTRVTEWETDREVTDRRLAQLKTADRLHNMRTIEFVEKDKSHHASRPSPRVGRSGRRVEHPLNLGASSGSRA